jgi:hypothetical protein
MAADILPSLKAWEYPAIFFFSEVGVPTFLSAWPLSFPSNVVCVYA